MIVTLILPEYLSAMLHEWTALPLETAGVLLVRRVPEGDQTLRLLAVEIHPVPEHAYIKRVADELVVSSDGYVPALRRAEELGAIPIWLHTHPGENASPVSSLLDNKVDSQLEELFRWRSGTDCYGALIVGQTAGELTFSGHLADSEGSLSIDRLMTVGPRIRLTWKFGTAGAQVSEKYHRNLLAFGKRVQFVIQNLSVAVVGCGGTGSAVAEQLIRLGVKDLLLIDPDILEESNLSRVYGSTPAELGKSKVSVLAHHLQNISPDSRIRTAKSSITQEPTARLLTQRDVIFGCTDDNAGRLILSRVSSYFLIPVFDLGVLLTPSLSNELGGIHGRITMLHPGAACLVCRGRVDLMRAGAELMSSEERQRRVAEGYAPGLPEAQPAVVAFTSLVASWAVSELLERLSGYGLDPAPSEILIRLHDREVSTNRQSPRRRHYCDPATGRVGIGMTPLFLDQTWAQ